MTYNLTIDQEFAVVNGLTLTQVSTLAAFMTLPVWSKTVAIDGNVWYLYSENQMAKDFPLLFSVSKRCYKNISELEKSGFVQLTKLGREKYVRFTEKCADWGKCKCPNCTESPKTDSKKSENGLKNSPKTDSDTSYINYNINNSNIKDSNNNAEGVLFPDESFTPIVVTNPRRTSEKKCLFADSKYFDYEKFAAEFRAKEFENIDLVYYYHALADWSASAGAKKNDWIATARNFIRGDISKGKLVTLNKESALSPDAIEYLKNMAD